MAGEPAGAGDGVFECIRYAGKFFLAFVGIVEGAICGLADQYYFGALLCCQQKLLCGAGAFIIYEYSYFLRVLFTESVLNVSFLMVV